MKLKILIVLFATLSIFTMRSFSQSASSVFDLVENDDTKNQSIAQNNAAPTANKPTLSQQNPNMILGPPSNVQNNVNLNENLTPINQSSLFTQTNTPTNNQNMNANGNNLQAMLDKIKSKVTNPYLKDNLTVENIANFFANFISGNSFVNNLEVKDIAEFNKVEIKDNLKVKGEATFEKIGFNKIKNRAMTITDNEIIFDPEATIKLKNNKIAFKVKDIFEVITFMKYIVKICGSKLEKCDFNNLLKNHNANQIMQIVRTFQKKIEETQKKANEFQEKKIKEEKLKKEEEEKNSKKLKEAKDLKESNESNEKKATQIKNLRGSEQNIDKNANTNKKDDDLITKHFTFKEKELNDIEKEISQDFMYKQSNSSFEDYSKFLENPTIADMMNSYYYSMPSFGLGMNNMMAPPSF